MKKLTNEELEKIKKMQKEFNTLAFEIGSIEIQLNDLINYKNNLLQSITKISNEEKEFTSFLQKNYGNGNIDMETGIITPINP